MERGKRAVRATSLQKRLDALNRQRLEWKSINLPTPFIEAVDALFLEVARLVKKVDALDRRKKKTSSPSARV